MKKTEDINKNGLFPKFQLIQILRFQVIQDVCFIAPIDYCDELSLVGKTFCEKCSHFILTSWSQPNSFGEMCFLEESLWKDARNSNFDNFEIAVYSKSGSMSLTKVTKFYGIFYTVMVIHWYKTSLVSPTLQLDLRPVQKGSPNQCQSAFL